MGYHLSVGGLLQAPVLACGAKRMAETAAHLVDHVIPHVPVRQFVLSVPKRLRPYLHYRPRTAEVDIWWSQPEVTS